jgi:lipopolysaccharide heptosyltransferase II
MDNPKKILVIQLKRAGDVIVTTPVVEALYKAIPGVKIDFLVDKPFAPLLENNPYLNGVQVFDRKAIWETWKRLRGASYDWVIDFQSSPRSVFAALYSGANVRAGYQVSFWGRFFNRSIKRPGGQISVTDGKMTLVRALVPDAPVAGERRIYLTEAERAWAAGVMGKNQGAGLIPTHRRPSRRWHAESFVSLAKRLDAQGIPVWLFWGPGEKDYVEAIHRAVPTSHFIPATSLRQMAALLGQCKIVITNDNGPMHLAVAVGAPTVTIYGPTNPVSWNPGGPRHRVVQAENLSCLGCNMNVCPFGHECMTWVTPDQVWKIGQELLIP